MLQSCLILCDPMDCSLPGSSDHGILQTRILGWVTLSSSKGSPRDRTCISCGSCIAGGFFTTWATREALKKQSIPFWLWQDSNLQSSDPKSDALSIRPHGHRQQQDSDFVTRKKCNGKSLLKCFQCTENLQNVYLPTTTTKFSKCMEEIPLWSRG